MQITLQPISPEQRRPKPANEGNLGFGKIYADHMFTMKWTVDKGWHDAVIGPFAPLTLSPATMVLHYGQSIFEGLKAYRRADGGFNLFRPQKNMERMNASARRMVMPEVDESLVLQAMERLVALDQDWVPRAQGASLYIRPTMIGTEPYVGVKPSSQYLFFIITGPVGAYYAEGFNPVKILVCTDYARAGSGGLGAVKASANYAASLMGQKQAQAKGYSQALWLDSCERKYLEEVGSSNIFLKIAGKVLTPPLGGTILAGVTRDSVIRLLQDWGQPVEERRISMDEVLAAQQNGQLEEVFGAGTAAVISPVGALNYQDREIIVASGKTGPVAQKLYETLTGIQYSRLPDTHGWTHNVPLE